MIGYIILYKNDTLTYLLGVTYSQRNLKIEKKDQGCHFSPILKGSYKKTDVTVISTFLRRCSKAKRKGTSLFTIRARGNVKRDREFKNLIQVSSYVSAFAIHLAVIYASQADLIAIAIVK